MAQDNTQEGQGEPGGEDSEATESEPSPAPNSALPESYRQELAAIRNMYMNSMESKNADLVRLQQEKEELMKEVLEAQKAVGQQLRVHYEQNEQVEQVIEVLRKQNKRLGAKADAMEQLAGKYAEASTVSSSQRDEARKQFEQAAHELQRQATLIKIQQAGIDKDNSQFSVERDEARKSAGELFQQVQRLLGDIAVKDTLLEESDVLMIGLRDKLSRVDAIIHEGDSVARWQGGRTRGRGKGGKRRKGKAGSGKRQDAGQ